MEIKERSLNEYLIFDVLCDITNDNSVELKDFILSHLNKKFRNVVLNLKKVVYLNSFALSVLLRISKDLKSMKYSFFLMNVPSSVIALLKVTQLLSFFNIIESEEKLEKKE
jgi:anti-anti-sigma factor